MIGRSRYLTERTFSLLASEVRGLQQAVYVLALFALLSSLLALVRDRIFAHIFGAGTTLDIYYAAFSIPDYIFVATGALVSVYILIPELARRSTLEQKRYIDTVVTGFCALAVVVSVIAFLAAPTILHFFFPLFTETGVLPALIALTRIMLLQPILLGLSNIFAAITQSHHRYFLYASSQLLYNIGIIVGALFFYPVFGISGLAWGVVLGAMLHAGIQLPSIFADGFFRALPRIYDARILLSTVAVSVPRALALSMTQVTFFGLKALAGLLASGSISIFMFAYNLQAVPLSIIGASYSVAAFPGLASALADGQRAHFLEYVAVAARYVMFWSLPSTALMIVLRAHIVRVILGSGAFNWTDTRLTAAAFALFGLSLGAQGLMLLLVRAYYAAGRTFVPFLISACVAMITIVLGAASVGALKIQFVFSAMTALLRVSDVPGATVLALAFAYAFVSILGTIALLIHFEHRFRGFLGQVLPSWGQSLLASIACGFGAYFMLQAVGPITLSSTVLTVFLRGFLGGIAGILACAAAYYLLGSREYRETVETIRGRIQRAPLPPSVVAAAEEQAVP